MCRISLIPLLIFLFSFWSCSSIDRSSKYYETKIDLSTNGDDIAFDKSAIQVPFGKTILLSFINRATHDSEITHNVAIIDLGKEKEVLDLMNDNDYEFDEANNPFKDKKYILATSKVLAPGKATVVEFTPKKPGLYTYICLMPGHGNMMNMKGVINVK